ncbi:hypothetical protein SEA_PUPPER_44 [Gordonia phage Pupper]|uniref:Uncharacterized protein n=1 Tax=Gordonia phage Pupper TaxID=2571249 RepID=A0A4Y6EIG5_9CAUD|nr:hypothetical protein KHQ83_gp233 [Gordonia phage Pupper]QDF18530.1 hypothetical protein SEA_PUPPER_44 [Gordonia phage Pupper]QDF18763.1 hypothetical protein SEA_SCENTAE_44 [Gordonia phage SCentae]
MLNVTIDHNGRQYQAQLMKIDSTSLGEGDHLFSAGLNCSRPGGGTTVGLRGFDEWDQERGERVFKSGYGLDFIRTMMKIGGVNGWEDLPGQRVYVLYDVAGGPHMLGRIADGIANVDTGEVMIFAEHAALWGLPKDES